MFFQRLYVAVNGDYYPIRIVEPAYENSSDSPHTLQWNIAAGWRFLF